MKKILIMSIILFIGGFTPSYAALSDYFGSLYLGYLELRNVDCNDREMLDFLYEISSSKIDSIEEFLNDADTKEDYKLAYELLCEEYDDLMENINFEIGFVANKPMSKRNFRKLRKCHKRVISELVFGDSQMCVPKRFNLFRH